MNKKQLEEIKKKVDEIRILINEDINGSNWLNEEFRKFNQRVNDELKDAVWREYNHLY